jgi:signal peptidase I
MLLWPNFYLVPWEQVPYQYKIIKESEEWIRTVLYVVVFYLAFTTVVAEAYQIPSGSMEPTLHGNPSLWQGDRVVALKWLSRFTPIERGDIVVFISVEDHKTFIVKRVVGLPGETVVVREPNVYVDGKRVQDMPRFRERRYTCPLSLRPHLYGVTSPYKVPKDCYFVMGDNSPNSNDSRFWGHLPARNILGKVVMVFWPPQHARILK